MSHHIVHISASPKQLSKLRNGHKVRIKPAMEGEGFNLIIDPSRLDLFTRTFSRGKGLEIALTPQELAVNQEASPQMEGSGIFGKKFDRFLEHNGLKKVAYSVGDAAKPAVKAALMGALGAGATALSGSQLVASGGLGAGAVPLIYGTAGSLGALGMDYLDNPSKYQGHHRETRNNIGGPIDKIAPSTLAGQAEQNHLLNNLNQHLGTQYGNLSKASIANAEAQKMRTAMNTDRFASLADTYNSGIDNNGFASFGAGIHHHIMRGGAIREKVSVGKMGSFVGAQTHLPPALVSQPFSANFQFQHTLPPAYQRFSKGGGLYA